MKSENSTINEVIENLEAKIRACVYQLRGAKNSLVACNQIVEVGVLTVYAKGEKRLASVENTNYPTQWDSKGVKEILAIDWKNGLGDSIEPKVYVYTDWYRKELKESWELRRDMLNRIAQVQA